MINQLTLIHNRRAGQAHPPLTRAAQVEALVQRFAQLGVTVGTLTFFGYKLEEIASARSISWPQRSAQRTFILPQPRSLPRAA